MLSGFFMYAKTDLPFLDASSYSPRGDGQLVGVTHPYRRPTIVTRMSDRLASLARHTSSGGSLMLALQINYSKGDIQVPEAAWQVRG